MSTYFISGHLDLTPDEFDRHYAPRLLTAWQQPDSRFVVGDAAGTDRAAQAWLAERGEPERVTVYHMLETPRNRCGDFALLGGYTNDAGRDMAMTRASTADIAWVRPGREDSGTAKNLLRRRLNQLGVPSIFTSKTKPTAE